MPSKNVRQRLDQFRDSYYKSKIRPCHIPSYRSNHILLSERLDVIWDDLANDIRYWLMENNHRRVKTLLTARVSGLTITNIPLDCSPTVIDKIIEAGITVNFDTCLSNHNSFYTLSRTTYIFNVIHNIRKHLDSSFILDINSGEYDLLREIFTYIKQPYRLNNHIKSRWSTIDFDQLLTSPIDNDVINCCVTDNGHGLLEAVLSTGYIPDIKSITWHKPSVKIMILILESSHLSDEYKIEYVTRICSEHVIVSMEIYYNPTCAKYLRMINKKDYDRIRVASYRRFIIDGVITPISKSYHITEAIEHYDLDYIKEYSMGKHRHYDLDLGTIIFRKLEDQALVLWKDTLTEQQKTRLYESIMKDDSKLSRCTNPRLREYWSKIPCDNENFIKYLEWKGIDLPPSIGNRDRSMIRIRRNISPDMITGLMRESYQDSNLTTLIRLINEGLVNMADYTDVKCSIIDKLDELII